jgi:hypothetical protein
MRLVYNEEWKKINGYEDYEISNLGRVISYKRYPEGKLLNLRIDIFGYRSAFLFKNGKSKTFKVHILVWEHFGVGDRDGYKIVVDHKDNDKLNNRIDNLQLLTNRENRTKETSRHKKSSKYVGVFRTKNKSNPWMAKIDTNYLGVFKTEEEASEAYQNALTHSHQ